MCVVPCSYFSATFTNISLMFKTKHGMNNGEKKDKFSYTEYCGVASIC